MPETAVLYCYNIYFLNSTFSKKQKMGSLFEQTRAYVTDRIAALLEHGETRLPTDHELATEITASYATLRLVMKELEQQGFIRRIRGSGTYLTAEAEKLLADSKRRRLYLYTPPFPDTPEHDYGALLLTTLRKEAEIHNWKVVLSRIRTHRDFTEHLEQKASSADAILYLPPTEPFSLETIGKLAQFSEKPLIVLDCELSNISIDNITTDGRRGGMLAAAHLLANGHRNIALLLCEPLLPQSRARLQGFNDALEMAGLHAELIDCHVHVEDPRDLLARRTLLKRLKQPYDFTAIFAISDAGAFGALQALEELNLVPGRDISLIGFDGIPAGEHSSPKLTTIEQPVDAICRTAIEWLNDFPHPHRKCQLSPILRPGETVRNLMQSAIAR